MRAIDADAFDERVRVAGGMSEEELTEDFKDGVLAVLYLLSNQPTIQPEPHWIPVTERLPESAEDDLEYPTVLVCFDNGDVDTACFYESTREWGCGDMYDRICHPIAWRPLPETYHEGVTE